MPGTKISGALLMTPTNIHPTNEDSTVAIIAPSKGKPASDNIDAFTAIIYTIAKNEVKPANISPLTVVLYFLILNKLLNLFSTSPSSFSFIPLPPTLYFYNALNIILKTINIINYISYIFIKFNY